MSHSCLIGLKVQTPAEFAKRAIGMNAPDLRAHAYCKARPTSHYQMSERTQNRIEVWGKVTVLGGRFMLSTKTRMEAKIELPSSEVSILSVTQATTATFTDLYFALTFLFFIQTGSKRVICPTNGEVIGEKGDVMIFPPGSVVTMENRPILSASYQADGVCFAHDLVDKIFADLPIRNVSPGVQVLRAASHQPFEILALIKETLNRQDLPFAIRQHRLLEPLIWLRQKGVQLPRPWYEPPWGKVRRLIETDLGHPWRVPEVAEYFAKSEASFRRWLAKSGPGFAKILLNTRLERGLTLLQTTNDSILHIALECGFKTQSHFADSFRKRFGIAPNMIRSAKE